jgi:hypothetical protein
VCNQQRHHKVPAQPVLALFPGKGAPHPLRERTPSWRTCAPVGVKRRVALFTPTSSLPALSSSYLLARPRPGKTPIFSYGKNKKELAVLCTRSCSNKTHTAHTAL